MKLHHSANPFFKVLGLVSLLFSIFLVGCGNKEKISGLSVDETVPSQFLSLPRYQQAIPASWKRVLSDANFSFAVPGDMQKGDAQGTDSQVGSYSNSSALVSYDYGNYSGHTDVPTEIIGGMPAEITVQSISSSQGYSRLVVVRFYTIGRGKLNLTMSVSINQDSDIEMAKTILRSIEF